MLHILHYGWSIIWTNAGCQVIRMGTCDWPLLPAILPGPAVSVANYPLPAQLHSQCPHHTRTATTTASLRRNISTETETEREGGRLLMKTTQKTYCSSVYNMYTFIIQKVHLCKNTPFININTCMYNAYMYIYKCICTLYIHTYMHTAVCACTCSHAHIL